LGIIITRDDRLETIALDIGLPRAYTPELYQQKHEAVFAHIEKAYNFVPQVMHSPFIHSGKNS